MRITKIEFLEPIKLPRGGQGQSDTATSLNVGDGTVTIEASGPGVRITPKGSDRCAVVPWGNVRWAHCEQEAAKEPAKK